MDTVSYTSPPARGTSVEVSNDRITWIPQYFVYVEGNTFVCVDRYDNIDFPEASGHKWKYLRMEHVKLSSYQTIILNRMNKGDMIHRHPNYVKIGDSYMTPVTFRLLVSRGIIQEISDKTYSLTDYGKSLIKRA